MKIEKPSLSLKSRKPRPIKTVEWHRTFAGEPLRLLFLSDLHMDVCREEAALFLAQKPDVILLVGDTITSPRLDKPRDAKALLRRTETLSFLQELAQNVPVVAALGNHESETHIHGKYRPCEKKAKPIDPIYPDDCRRLLTEAGVQVIMDQTTQLCLHGVSLCIGGVLPCEWQKPVAPTRPACDVSVLLCHQPEYFPYLQQNEWDLTVSGHAHGGQWRFFGRGVYAPGQGLFPKYTDGFYENERLYVCRGMGNHNKIPRFFNAPQVDLFIVYGN